MMKLKLTRGMVVLLVCVFAHTIGPNASSGGDIGENTVETMKGILRLFVDDPNKPKPITDPIPDDLKRKYEQSYQIKVKFLDFKEILILNPNYQIPIYKANVADKDGLVCVLVQQMGNMRYKFLPITFTFDSEELKGEYSWANKLDSSGNKEKMRQMIIQYFKLDVGPVTQVETAQASAQGLSYVPQRDDPKGKVIAAMGRVPDDNFFLRGNDGNKVAGAEMIAYYAEDGSVLVIALFEDKVVSTRKVADKDAYNATRSQTAYVAAQ